MITILIFNILKNILNIILKWFNIQKHHYGNQTLLHNE